MDKLKTNFVIEIMGRPADHIKKALLDLIARIETEKGVKITDKKIHDPVPVKDSKDLFTAFTEISADLDNLSNYLGLIFAYMPSHVEIISPENISINNQFMNDLGNSLLGRLHNYDAIAKKTLAERQFLLEKLKESAPHLFKQPANNQQPAIQPTAELKKDKTNNSKKSKKAIKKKKI